MEFTERTKLYNNGYPVNFGYSKNGTIEFNPEDGKIPFLRMKEWDFYQLINRKFSMYVIIGHVSYATSLNCTLFDFETGKNIYIGKLLPFKKVMMDKSSFEDSDVKYESDEYKIEFKRENGTISVILDAFDKTYGKCKADIKLTETQKDSILVSTPFENKKHFYLNRKSCLMKCSGYAKFGDEIFEFKEDDTFGLTDWGRGVLPFKHNWVWGNGSGIVNGKYFGFNIGIFGNNENGSENIFFYNGKSYKLNKVDIKFDENDYMKDWYYESDDRSFVFKMHPVYDNHTKTKMLWVDNECHQVFGEFSGYIITENGKTEINDFFAFAENAHNRW